MAIVDNQRRVLREMFAALRPRWRAEAGLPERIERLLRSDRRLGSRDRRLYRELVYTTLRYLNWIEPWLDREDRFADEAIAWLSADLPATHAYRAALLGSASAERGVERRPSTPDSADGGVPRGSQPPSSSPAARDDSRAEWPPCPPDVAGKAAILARRSGGSLPELLPSWAPSEAPLALEAIQLDALHRRAPLWVRLSDGGEAALVEFAERGWPCSRSGRLPSALRIDAEADLTKTEAFAAGRFEIQDLGSQLILAGAAPEPGGRWLDACAGAGGKTLQLAELLGPRGSVDAHDVRPHALEEMERRAARAGLSDRIRRPDKLAPAYDGVLVDAPCTGSGTWRRSPHLKATTRLSDIAAAGELQVSLLTQFAAYVRRGGRLLYATCSICPRENERVVERFLGSQPGFASEPPARAFQGRSTGSGLLFAPADHDGDGFFVACLKRNP